MAVYDKRHLEPYIKELEEHFGKLLKEVKGEVPDTANAERYHMSPEQFEKEMVEVSFDNIMYQVDHFKAIEKHLKSIKGLAKKPVG